MPSHPTQSVFSHSSVRYDNLTPIFSLSSLYLYLQSIAMSLMNQSQLRLSVRSIRVLMYVLASYIRLLYVCKPVKNILYINTGLQYAYDYDKYYVQTTALV